VALIGLQGGGNLVVALADWLYVLPNATAMGVFDVRDRAVFA
jgi:hypothetical protein